VFLNSRESSRQSFLDFCFQSLKTSKYLRKEGFYFHMCTPKKAGGVAQVAEFLLIKSKSLGIILVIHTCTYARAHTHTHTHAHMHTHTHTHTQTLLGVEVGGKGRTGARAVFPHTAARGQVKDKDSKERAMPQRWHRGGGERSANA
jgi:hypothetical protein